MKDITMTNKRSDHAALLFFSALFLREYNNPTSETNLEKIILLMFDCSTLNANTGVFTKLLAKLELNVASCEEDNK